MEPDLEQALNTLWIDIGNYSLTNRCMNDPEFLKRHQCLQDWGFVIGDISHPSFFSFEKISPGIKEKLETFGCDYIVQANVIEIMAHGIMNIQQHGIVDGLPYGVWLYRVYKYDDKKGVFEFYTMDRGPGVPIGDNPKIIAWITEPGVSFGTFSEEGDGLMYIKQGSDFLGVESNGYTYDTQRGEVRKVDLPVEHGFRLKVIKYLTAKEIE